MATHAPSISAGQRTLRLEQVSTFPKLRALMWDGDILYALHGYTLLSARPGTSGFAWKEVASYRPEWWRNLSSRSALGFRLLRDGFHALAITPRSNLVAAAPGAIATLHAGEQEFRVTHRLQRGTRLCTSPPFPMAAYFGANTSTILIATKFASTAPATVVSPGALRIPSADVPSATFTTLFMTAGKSAYGSSLETTDPNAASCVRLQTSNLLMRCSAEISRRGQSRPWLHRRDFIFLPTRHSSRTTFISSTATPGCTE